MITEAVSKCLTTSELKVGRYHVNALDLAKDPVSSLLFLSGILGVRENKIVPGYTCDLRSGQWVPGTVCEALSNVAHLFGYQRYALLFAQQLRQQYRLDKVTEQALIQREHPPKSVIDEGYLKLKVAVTDLRRQFGERFWCLRDSFVFYNLCTTLYLPRAGSMHVFSRTSGLVCPDEHYGNPRLKKNPYRKSYFEHGIYGGLCLDLPVYYQWDPDTTAVALWKGYRLAAQRGRRKQYERDAVSVLSRFLRFPNLEITQASFAGFPYSYKELFTLTSDFGIVLSARDPELRKINHGLLYDGVDSCGVAAAFLERFACGAAHPKVSSDRQAPSPDDIRQALRLQYQIERHTVIKNIGEVLRDPRSQAEEVVDSLMKRGRTIAQEESVSGVR